MNVGVVGARAFDSACFIHIIARGAAQGILGSDNDGERLRGLVTDMQYCTRLCPPARLAGGDSADFDGAEQSCSLSARTRRPTAPWNIPSWPAACHALASMPTSSARLRRSSAAALTAVILIIRNPREPSPPLLGVSPAMIE